MVSVYACLCRTLTKLSIDVCIHVHTHISHTWRERLSVTNLSSENNLPMFRLNAPVVIRVKVKRCEQMLLFIAIQSKRRQVIFRAQVDNLLFIYAEAN